MESRALSASESPLPRPAPRPPPCLALSAEGGGIGPAWPAVTSRPIAPSPPRAVVQVTGHPSPPARVRSRRRAVASRASRAPRQRGVAGACSPQN